MCCLGNNKFNYNRFAGFKIKNMHLSFLILIACILCFTGIVPAWTSPLLKSDHTLLNESIPVLMYHSIAYEKNNPVRVPTEKFRQQMKYLKDNGYNTLTLDELYDCLEGNRKVPEKPTVITFDDGYADNYKNAFPILKGYGLKATIFVITDTIDKSPSYLNSKQLKELQQNGIDVESHCFTHKDHDKLSYSEQLSQMKDSRLKLEKVLNKKIKYYALVNGKYNADTLECLQKSGYKMAFSMDGRWASRENGLFTLYRVYISGYHDMSTFKERISNPHYRIAGSSMVVSEAKKKEMLIDLCERSKKYLLKGRYKDGISVAEAVLKQDNKYYQAYNLKGINLCYSGDFINGMKYIDKALSINPDFAYARFNKALAYELFGYSDKAITWYKNTLEKDPGSAWSYYGIASVYGRKGDLKNTVYYLKKAMELSSDAKKEAIHEKDFDPVRNSAEFRKLIH